MLHLLTQTSVSIEAIRFRGSETLEGAIYHGQGPMPKWIETLISEERLVRAGGDNEPWWYIITSDGGLNLVAVDGDYLVKVPSVFNYIEDAFDVAVVPEALASIILREVELR